MVWQEVDAVDIELDVPTGRTAEAGTAGCTPACRRGRRVSVDTLTLLAPIAAATHSHSIEIDHTVSHCHPLNPLECTGNYSATSNNMKLVHWPLTGGIYIWYSDVGTWAGPQPARVPPRCTTHQRPVYQSP